MTPTEREAREWAEKKYPLEGMCATGGTRRSSVKVQEAALMGYLAGAAQKEEQRRKDFEAGRTIDRSCIVDGRGFHPWLFDTYEDYRKQEG